MKYQKGYKYQLAEHFYIRIMLFPEATIQTEMISLSDQGDLNISKFYAWDGASGPTIDTDNSMVPGLVHDALYQLIRQGHLPEHFKGEVDLVFRQLLLDRGMSRLRARLWWRGVWGFGKSSATAGHNLTGTPLVC